MPETKESACAQGKKIKSPINAKLQHLRGFLLVFCRSVRILTLFSLEIPYSSLPLKSSSTVITPFFSAIIKASVLFLAPPNLL